MGNWKLTRELDGLLSPAAFFASLYCTWNTSLNLWASIFPFREWDHDVFFTGSGKLCKWQGSMVSWVARSFWKQMHLWYSQEGSNSLQEKDTGFSYTHYLQSSMPPFFTFCSRECPGISQVLIEGGHPHSEFSQEGSASYSWHCLFSFSFALFICFLGGVWKREHGSFG